MKRLLPNPDQSLNFVLVAAIWMILTSAWRGTLGLSNLLELMRDKEQLEAQILKLERYNQNQVSKLELLDSSTEFQTLEIQRWFQSFPRSHRIVHVPPQGKKLRTVTHDPKRVAVLTEP